MSEGPYRDLGNGFARLTGAEGARRAPSRIRVTEDALRELVRNAVDTGAANVYVATTLHARRYRELVVLDDGEGVPESYRQTIFEPGVTTRHLSPSRLDGDTHGAGVSLYHVKEAAVSAEVVSTGSPTSIRIVFDTETLPERSLQSESRASRSNLLATLRAFAKNAQAPDLYYGSPASILALLQIKRIIPEGMTVGDLKKWCREAMGVELSRRTLQRVASGRVKPAVRVEEPVEAKSAEAKARERFVAGGRLRLDERDVAEIRAVIERAARESYLEVERLEVHSREGEITLRARIYEAEEEYDFE